jgi:hypothetical protein
VSRIYEWQSALSYFGLVYFDRYRLINRKALDQTALAVAAWLSRLAFKSHFLYDIH